MSQLCISVVLCRSIACRTLLCDVRIPISHSTCSSSAFRQYCVDDKNIRKSTSLATIRTIQNQLNCEQKEALKFYEGINLESKTIINKLKVLNENGVTIKSIMENPLLLTIRK